MFWNNFVTLCNKNSTTPTAIANALGIAIGSITKWKNGSTPRDTTLKKIADYFGVTVDYLLIQNNESHINTNNNHKTNGVQKMIIDINLLLSRLEKLCVERGITLNTAFVESGVGKNFKSNLKISNPSMGKITMLSNYFGVSVDYLIGKIDNPRPEIHGNAIILDPTKTRMIRVYESVSAGFGAMAQDLVVDYMPIYIHSDSEAEETICIKVTGDSMSPEIENGDVIQVHKQCSVDSGSIAVVLNGDEALVKKVTYGANYVELHSLNPAYPSLRFEGADLANVTILGLVKNVIKSPTPHRIPANLDTEIQQLTDDLSPDERKEVEQFIKYLKSKRS